MLKRHQQSNIRPVNLINAPMNSLEERADIYEIQEEESKFNSSGGHSPLMTETNEASPGFAFSNEVST